jgi:hypothetical protein
MSEAKFKKNVEWYLHIISNLYTFFGCVYLLIGKHFNQGLRGVCEIEVSSRCLGENSSIECLQERRTVQILRWVFMDALILLILAWFVFAWMTIKRAVSKQQKKSSRTRKRRLQVKSDSSTSSNFKRRRSSNSVAEEKSEVKRKIDTPIQSSLEFNVREVKAKIGTSLSSLVKETQDKEATTSRRRKVASGLTLEVQARGVRFQGILFSVLFSIVWIFPICTQ